MLGDGVKVPEMPVRAADQRQRVRDILNLYIVRIWIQRIKMYAGNSGDVAHKFAPKCSYSILQQAAGLSSGSCDI